MGASASVGAIDAIVEDEEAEFGDVSEEEGFGSTTESKGKMIVSSISSKDSSAKDSKGMASSGSEN